MPNRSRLRLYCYGLATVLCLLSIAAIVIDGRFRDCLRSDTFSTNSIHASDEDIHNHCARTMGVFAPLYK